jgi:thiamine-monophosphate kinase
MARASGVVVDLELAALGADLDRLRVAAAALDSASGDSVDATDADAGADVGDRAEGWVLSGGEDHALLAMFPADADLPDAFRAIGTVRTVEGEGAGVRVDGRVAHRATGWDHFRA